MNVGPDGSLCRITSSAKDLVNNVRVIKVPDSKPSYKLIVIRPTEEDEESSEMSDEVTSDDELCDVKFSSESTEKEKVIDPKSDKPNETVSKENAREHNHYNRRRAYQKRNNSNRFHGRRNDNYNKIARKHKSLSGMEGIYKYGNRDFNSAPSHSAAYIPSNQHPSDDIQPWLNHPLHTNYSCTPFSLVPVPEKPKSVGLLGDRPSYAPSIPHFQSNNQTDNYIHDQNSTYSPMASGFQPIAENDRFIYDQNSPYSPMTANFASNNHNNSFIHNQNSYPQIAASKQTDNVIRDQNYWNGDYCNYNKNNQLGNKKHLNTKNNRKKDLWKRSPRRHPNVRNNASFDYRN